MSNNIVIMDRDGVINKDSGDYIRSAAEWTPIEGSIEALVLLKEIGKRVFVATNQSGIGRGLFDESELEAIHKKMIKTVEKAGGQIEGVVHCPHQPSDLCECRKPRLGLLRQIEQLADQSVLGCPFVGDSLRDIEAAQAAGCEPVLVLTGNGLKTKPLVRGEVEVFNNLSEFAKHLVTTHLN